MSVAFDALNFHFSDICLIEASAGTGKTYSLANLYLRLVLGHVNDEGVQNGFSRALPVDEILVLTFTNAATFELKKRIHQRIQNCLAYFINDDTQTNDLFLKGLREQFSSSENLENACNRLRYAITLIDQASIFTLHSFCQRLVKENVFALEQNKASTFEIESVSNIEQLLLDIWRILHKKENNDLQTAIVFSHWKNFEKFKDTFKDYLDQHLFTEIEDPMVDLNTSFDSLFSSPYYQEIATFKKNWLAQEEHIINFFSQPCINNARNYQGRIKKIHNFCVNKYSFSPDKKILLYFTSNEVSNQNKKGEAHPKHLAIFKQIDLIYDMSSKNTDIKIHQWILIQARHRWAELKQQQQLVYPNDILHQLKTSLKENPEFLAHVRQRFPVALIDEFQDTDQLQYEIFKSIYHQQAALSLVLIGDPKQAIYKFRGADLYTYINAKKLIDESRHFHMQSNWRSSAAMVHACNILFSSTHNIFRDKNIPFINVESNAHIKDGKPLTGVKNTQTNEESHLEFMLYDHITDLREKGLKESETSTKTDAVAVLFEHCAQQISMMLNDTTMLVNGRAIKSSDICILVRDRSQAKQIKSALLERHIASVYLSNETVYQSECAQALSYFLNACLNSGNTTSIKTLLSTSFYQETYQSLLEKDDDPVFLKKINATLINYLAHWENYGIASLIEFWISTEDIYDNLLAIKNGLRWITDLQHLSQLLQENSKTLSTPTQIYDALISDIDVAVNGSYQQNLDHQKLRLDNDQSLVSIVTVHTSKGLEFPIVFYPFACDAKKASGFVVHKKNKQQKFTQIINFDNKSEHIAKQLDEERLAEDIRLLYVAMTRAKYACYIGIANSKTFNLSALASLLGLPFAQKIEFGELEKKLQLLCKNNQILYSKVNRHTINEVLSISAQADNSTSNKALTIYPPPIAPKVQQRWNLLSYSKIASHAAHSKNNDANDSRISEYQGGDEWSPSAEKTIHDISSTPKPDRLNFPKGPVIGQWLHAILEEINFGSLDDPLNNDHHQHIDDIVSSEESQCKSLNISKDQFNIINPWIKDILSYQFDLNGAETNDPFSLSMIEPSKYQPELHFYFSIKNECNTHELNKILRSHGYLNTQTDLSFRSLQGLLTGFIDLTFEHNNQYYILDYKSNFLGCSMDNYLPAQLRSAITDHKYDLQYILYTLALHRLLKQRMNDYNYEIDVGGCIYLFLRGVPDASINNMSQTNSGVLFDKPSKQLIEQLDDFFEGKPS